jgi:2'-5' RNA ligase
VRLFIAIQIPDEIRSQFAALLKEFRVIAPQAKWVRPENLHVTLKFLGETESSKLTALQNALSTVVCERSVALEFHGLGFFPNEKRPRVFWAGMQSSPNLQSLAASLDRAVHKLGFPLEDRPFAPHLTLARFQPAVAAPKLLEAVHEKMPHLFGSLRASEFHLVESKLKPTGAEYTNLQSFRFVSEG